jgi:hypothetical protein
MATSDLTNPRCASTQSSELAGTFANAAAASWYFPDRNSVVASSTDCAEARTANRSATRAE